MAYTYNKYRIKEFTEQKGFGGRTIANKLGMSNDKAPRGWIAGSELIRMDHFLNFVNTFHLNLLEFFMDDGIRMDTQQTEAVPEENTTCSEPATSVPTSDDSDFRFRLMTEMAELKVRHTRELMQKDIDLARKELELAKRERDMSEKIRAELKKEFEQDRQQLVESYENRLTKRDETIGKLQIQLAELTAEYKELENASQKDNSYLPMSNSGGVAERGYNK